MKLFGGMVWPESGNPGFLCLVKEKTKTDEGTFDPETIHIEITGEHQSASITDLFKVIKDTKHLQAVYTQDDPKYRSFVYEYSVWRRENSCPVMLRSARISSFEAGIMKIKDHTKKGTITFPDNSLVKAQLMVFSKLSLKNESDCYAVSALTQVIASFNKRKIIDQEKEPSMKSWY